MVSLIEMPDTVSKSIVKEAAPRPEPEIEAGMIEIEQLDFAYGTNQVLHDINLSIPAKAVTAFIGRSGWTAVVTGALLLLIFIPEHISLWDKFPIWYHLTFLTSLVPLAVVGGWIAGSRIDQPFTHRSDRIDERKDVED